MAIIACPECGGKVSDTAEACPHCGTVIAGRQHAAAIKDRVVTQQGTAKRLKAQVAMSVMGVIIGLIMFFVGSAADDGSSRTPAMVGVLLLLGSLVWLFVLKIRIWWHHG